LDILEIMILNGKSKLKTTLIPLEFMVIEKKENENDDKGEDKEQ